MIQVATHGSFRKNANARPARPSASISSRPRRHHLAPPGGDRHRHRQRIPQSFYGASTFWRQNPQLVFARKTPLGCKGKGQRAGAGQWGSRPRLPLGFASCSLSPMPCFPCALLPFPSNPAPPRAGFPCPPPHAAGTRRHVPRGKFEAFLLFWFGPLFPFPIPRHATLPEASLASPALQTPPRPHRSYSLGCSPKLRAASAPSALSRIACPPRPPCIRFQLRATARADFSFARKNKIKTRALLNPSRCPPSPRSAGLDRGGEVDGRRRRQRRHLQVGARRPHRGGVRR